jgi:hydrogenase-4 component B
MAYTASSFAQILVGLYGWLLRSRSGSVVCKEVFPPARSFHVIVPEQVMDGVLTPLWAGFRRTLIPLRALQQGRIQQYLVYVLLTLCVLLVSLLPIDRILTRFFGW